MGKFIGNPPSANILMTSMRSMGYTLEGALADVIDNSISAGAKNIHIEFPKESRYCYVSICDDGKGMSDPDLCEAMKYGSSLVGNNRKEDDLGRFGLGLKSASLSQCKKLTVASKHDNVISAYIWDIDLVGNDWLIQKCDEEEIDSIFDIERLRDLVQGTLVVWEKFDIIEKSSCGDAYAALNGKIGDVSKYLELIFHRFLNSETKKISISIGEYNLIGLDPFLEKHPKTTHKKERTLPILDSNDIERQIVVKPFILPYQKYLSKTDMDKLGGLDSYQTKQGFYIYRNMRLIIWGTWFRMKPKHEITNQARVRVDIPNMLDDIWCIDIKKQSAILPNSIKNQLVKAVEETMGFAIKAQRFRGRIANVNDDIDYIWNRFQARNQRYIYQVNRNSSIFKLLDDVDDDTRKKIDMVLEEIENNMPYQQIYLDMCDHIIDDTADDERKADICNKARRLIAIFVSMGNSAQDAINSVFTSEPFVNFPKMKDKLAAEMSE